MPSTVHPRINDIAIGEDKVRVEKDMGQQEQAEATPQLGVKSQPALAHVSDGWRCCGYYCCAKRL
jgi:hypothetical protein